MDLNLAFFVLIALLLLELAAGLLMFFPGVARRLFRPFARRIEQHGWSLRRWGVELASGVLALGGMSYYLITDPTIVKTPLVWAALGLTAIAVMPTLGMLVEPFFRRSPGRGPVSTILSGPLYRWMVAQQVSVLLVLGVITVV